MSVQHHNGHDRAPGYRAIRFNMDWITRPLFGAVLVVIVISALVMGPDLFAGLVVLMALFAAREWHRMVRKPAAEGGPAPHGFVHVQTAVTALVVAGAVGLLLLHQIAGAAALVALGAVGAYALARGRGDNALWQAAGVVYIGLPALALVGLRTFSNHGVQVIVGLFVIVWASDTGALIIGNIFGGPRLAPRLSPGKTWSGTIGGSLTAALAFGLYIGLLGHDGLPAAAFAFALSWSAHAGDLFESFVKRRFHVKDTGTMIPGHGGVLDRVDSTFFASLVLALLVFGFHLNPLFGGHS